MSAASTCCTPRSGLPPNAATPCSRPASRRCAGSVSAPGASAPSPPPPWSCSTTCTTARHDQHAVGAVTGNGSLSKAGGGFRIDHPMEPSSRYLNHSFVESPDMMNVYNGNVTTDIDGNAVVELPRYFEALNRDFRYQLTVIGQFAQAIVAEDVRENRFSIRTDRPEVRVSWQVTGVRPDAWANDHRPEAEEDKPEEERGGYLAAEEHGQPMSAGLFYVEVSTSEEPREQTGAPSET